MNVESLRSNQQQNQVSAEIRIAKVAVSICFLFVASWTPYAVMALIGAFGNQYVIMTQLCQLPYTGSIIVVSCFSVYSKMLQQNSSGP
jgi:r-opsin